MAGSRGGVGGKGKINTIEGLGWGNVGSSSRSSTDAEKDPREMVKPVSSRCTSSKSIFEAVVKRFDESIGWRMVGGGGAVLDMELATKAVPESRGELRAPVRGDGVGYSKTGNPVVNEGGCTSIGGGGGEGNSFWPTGSAVNNGEEMGMLGGGRKGAYKIHMNV